MIFMLNNNAQESAPFELLVAIVVMGFVILFGMNALQSLQTQQCGNELEHLLASVEDSVESVVNQQIPQRLLVKFPPCYKNPELVLKPVVDESLCTSFCLRQVEQCVLLRFESKDEGEISCVEINPSSNFGQQDSCPLRDDGSEPIDPTNGISQGTYLLYNKTPVGAVLPTICMYKQGV